MTSPQVTFSEFLPISLWLSGCRM